MKLNRRTVGFASLAGASLVVALLPPSPAPAYTGAFMSHPRQASPQSFSGNNVVVANRSWAGHPNDVCLTVSNAVNVTINNVDFDGCGGGIYLVDVRGVINITNVRARNTGNGEIGSGMSNVIQLSRTWQTAPELSGGGARIRSIKVYGGNTEDVISIYQSGGIDAAHPLVLGDIHVEHPLSGPLAWQSDSSTCANLADAGGHDIRLQNSTFLNCAAVGLQMNEPDRNVRYRDNTVYGAPRLESNVGLSQWSSGDCPTTCPNNAYVRNRVNWRKASGSRSDIWLSGNYPVALVDNTTNAPISPANLRVVLTTYRDVVMGDAPLAYWRFVNTNSETGSHHGTLRGSPLLNQPGPFAGSKSIRFDGVLRDNATTGGFLANSLARLSSTTWTNGFTLEAWAKTTTSGPEQHVVTWSDSAGNAGPGTLFDDPDDRWKFRDGNVSVSQTNSTTINAWHHVVATVNSAGNGTLYVNGQSVRTWTSGVDPVASSSGLFTVGADYDSHDCPCPHVDTPFNGWIAEVAVYNRPLTQARVQAHLAAR